MTLRNEGRHRGHRLGRARIVCFKAQTKKDKPHLGCRSQGVWPKLNHIVLLGDSIFDNGAYVQGGPDVIRQLQAKLPDGWSATLCAVDGSMVQNVQNQLAKLGCRRTQLT
jgi:hypothetical protein